jgi:hypothetical protein
LRDSLNNINITNKAAEMRNNNKSDSNKCTTSKKQAIGKDKEKPSKGEKEN